MTSRKYTHRKTLSLEIPEHIRERMAEFYREKGEEVPTHRDEHITSEYHMSAPNDPMSSKENRIWINLQSSVGYNIGGSAPEEFYAAVKEEYQKIFEHLQKQFPDCNVTMGACENRNTSVGTYVDMKYSTHIDIRLDKNTRPTQIARKLDKAMQEIGFDAPKTDIA